MSNNFNMSFDANTRQQFADVLADYGLTVPQAFKLFANQVVKTGVVPLSFDWARQPNATTIRAMQELDNGGGKLYANLDELLAEHGYATSQDQ
ncbi:type II toxin-antitoxin system RelB/DinJ family antitoxin [Moraxella ovis]|uniref:type II toxin-antitoxin system RelB/DinJ family antitoxin n=1 Tax=Moraxella ovis TaxID=29433 RepID=UPI000D91CA97|nr:type II toxin-antitoxin system RelB/DinJ family antitoxin [Moraxella ovis]SPX84291.1 addiction module antitoxin, RelB/DinJ family [Moraxella ovis]STZ31883.1 addiction module antitoxin, RelB/DinJ family [Moraxella ovis]STZ31893.1 addiction module antitoxin, RelB/DinJ family [Moraxella ovis]